MRRALFDEGAYALGIVGRAAGPALQVPFEIELGIEAVVGGGVQSFSQVTAFRRQTPRSAPPKKPVQRRRSPNTKNNIQEQSKEKDTPTSPNHTHIFQLLHD